MRMQSARNWREKSRQLEAAVLSKGVMQISESEGRFSVAEKRKFVNLDIRVVLVNVESESNRPLLPFVDAVTLSNAPEEAACAIAAFLGLANACVGLVLILSLIHI